VKRQDSDTKQKTDIPGLITLTPKQATIEFLRELLRDVRLPEQIIIGEPAIRDTKWVTVQAPSAIGRCTGRRDGAD
jgi:hypothetical protein